MSNTYLDNAIEAVPRFAERISLFTKKLRLAQYADSTIYSYRLKISQAVLYLGKLPDDFTQEDILHTWGSNLFYHPHIHCSDSVRPAVASASS